MKARLITAALLLLSLPCLAQQASEDWPHYHVTGAADARWDACVKKGFDLFARGSVSKAGAQFDKAVKAGCPDGLVLFRLAACHYYDGQPERALALLDRAIPDLDSRYPRSLHRAQVHNLKGIILMEGGKPRLAEAEFKTALKLSPSFSDPHNNLGKLYTMERRRGEASLEFEQAIQLDPKNIQAQINLGILHELDGNHDEALAACNKALSLDPRDP
ncbi:MAG: tetratricopeptide repeat protein, partial [Candidatus Aureabacteria bacterium]|nr:tetratricopeptide repeat protein [Candidatus Auribacterota bacterium]